MLTSHAGFRVLAIMALLICGVAIPTASAGDDDVIFANGFDDAVCGFGLPVGTERQTIVPARFHGFTLTYLQPAAEYVDLFGYYPGCVPNGRHACTNLIPFNGVTGASNWLKLVRSDYIALAFTTGTRPPAKYSFGLMINGSTNNAAMTTTTISDRCGDFDARSPWLSRNLACVGLNTHPESAFKFTVIPGGPYCALTNSAGVEEPDKVWYMNIRVNSCNDVGGTCTILYDNY